MDDYTLEVAVELAIRKRNRELLIAALALGYNPREEYRYQAEPGARSPVEQAALLSWGAGLALMGAVH